jgi:hypothetical protein
MDDVTCYRFVLIGYIPRGTEYLVHVLDAVHVSGQVSKVWVSLGGPQAAGHPGKS